MEVATIGGGCFWCVEALLQQLKGVEKIVQIDLSDIEKKQFNNSIKAVENLFAAAKKNIM